MKKTKTNKQLPGQLSLFDGQKMEELYNQSKVLGKAIADELAALTAQLDKMSLDEWYDDKNLPNLDIKDCLVIAGINIADVIKQLEKATAIEFQLRISNSLQDNSSVSPPY